MSLPHLRLGVNIDHVATVRNARGGAHPNPVRAAVAAEAAGADGITAHLREDRRHIRDADMYAIRQAVTVPLNFEMAATDEMVGIALDVKPNAACIVPERREEVTTEGGLAVAGRESELEPYSRAFVTPASCCRFHRGKRGRDPRRAGIADHRPVVRRRRHYGAAGEGVEAALSLGRLDGVADRRRIDGTKKGQERLIHHSRPCHSLDEASAAPSASELSLA